MSLLSLFFFNFIPEAGYLLNILANKTTNETHRLTICRFFNLPISGEIVSKSLSPKYNALRESA